MLEFINPDRYQGPGTVVSVPVIVNGIEVQHYALTADVHGPDNFIRTIGNSKRSDGVTDETLTAFAAGRPVTFHGRWGNLPGDVVLANARLLIGRRWTLTWNCEHFVRWASGVSPASPQLSNGMVAVGVVGLVALCIGAAVVARKAA